MARVIRTPGAPAEAQAEPAAEQAAATEAAQAEPEQDLPEDEPEQVMAQPEPVDEGPKLRAADVNERTIRGPVLTADGWVCPDESGRKPVDALRA